LKIHEQVEQICKHFSVISSLVSSAEQSVFLYILCQQLTGYFVRNYSCILAFLRHRW
jgi:hypothetical protein